MRELNQPWVFFVVVVIPLVVGGMCAGIALSAMLGFGEDGRCAVCDKPKGLDSGIALQQKQSDGRGSPAIVFADTIDEDGNIIVCTRLDGSVMIIDRRPRTWWRRLVDAVFRRK